MGVSRIALCAASNCAAIGHGGFGGFGEKSWASASGVWSSGRYPADLRILSLINEADANTENSTKNESAFVLVCALVRHGMGLIGFISGHPFFGGWHFGSAFNADQLRPMLEPVIWSQIPSTHLQIGFALNEHSEIGCARLHPVHDVLKMPFGGFAFGRELVALLLRKRGNECFEVHRSIKPFGFVFVKTIRFTCPALLCQ